MLKFLRGYIEIVLYTSSVFWNVVYFENNYTKFSKVLQMTWNFETLE